MIWHNSIVDSLILLQQNDQTAHYCHRPHKKTKMTPTEFGWICSGCGLSQGQYYFPPDNKLGKTVMRVGSTIDGNNFSFDSNDVGDHTIVDRDRNGISRINRYSF